MKLKQFSIIFGVALTVISLMVLFFPLIQPSNLNNSLVRGSGISGASYSYEMDAMGPVNFYSNNAISRDVANLGLTTSFINISMKDNIAIFSVKLYGEPAGDNQIYLAKSFVLDVGRDSKLFESFFPSSPKVPGTLINVFNVTSVYSGFVNAYSEVNVGNEVLHSTTQKLTMINVPSQPSGYYGNVSRILGANSAYYINSPSGMFLSYILFSGNSSVVSALFDNSSVSNVSLLSICLESTNVAVDLNLAHYITQFVDVVVIIWVFGVAYMIYLYRRASRKENR